MDFINQLLAGFIASFKQKNPKIFGIIISALVLVFVGIQTIISQGVIAESNLTLQIIQYIDVLMLALVGSKTAPYLSEYLTDGNLSAQSVADDGWWTKLVDGFKLKSPVAYGIVAVALLTSFTGITYAIQFGLILDSNISLMLKIVSYIELGGLILLGSRTGQYIIDGPPQLPRPDEVTVQSMYERATYYD